MSARNKAPVFSGSRPVLGKARVRVQVGAIASPAVSPVVESTPDGVSRDRIGVSVSSAPAINTSNYCS